VRFVCADGEPQYERMLDAEQLATLEREGHELVWLDGPPDTADGWIERLRGADGLFLLWLLPGGVLRASPSVRVVSFAGTGVETYVDLDEARERGVAVCNVPHYGANAIAEHALALILAVARRVPQGNAEVRAGSWEQTEGVELRGRQLGVVGAGPVGARMMELGRAVGMAVVYWTRRPREVRSAQFVELDELFATSDVVSLHLAHVPETEGIVDRRLLGLLQPHAILVNTARGALVDESALAELLEAGAIRGAGVDVLGTEPPPDDHPLLHCERAVLTPHVAFHTAESARELVRVTLENLIAFARGTPQNVRT
jgi:phosphoglycerate dehydrogenase-like enzyme